MQTSSVFKLMMGKLGVTPLIKISMNNLIPVFIQSKNGGELVVNPVYQDSINFFRNKFESPELKSSRDYEFVVVDKEIFVTPLNESAWEKLKPWKLTNKELLEVFGIIEILHESLFWMIKGKVNH